MFRETLALELGLFPGGPATWGWAGLRVAAPVGAFRPFIGVWGVTGVAGEGPCEDLSVPVAEASSDEDVGTCLHRVAGNARAMRRHQIMTTWPFPARFAPSASGFVPALNDPPPPPGPAPYAQPVQ